MSNQNGRWGSCTLADRTIRIDAPVAAGRSIVVVANEEPIRIALFTFSTRVLALSVFVSALTSLLVFVSLYLILVRPMQRMTAAMIEFRNNPEDPARILLASSRRDEIGMAERELSALQHELYGFLQQKTRLASLGLTVAKIQHDLRNILSSAQIASDRLAASEDPVVKRVTPRLVDALDRAVALATNTLRYGRAEERTPQRTRFLLAPLIDEAASSAVPEAGEVQLEMLLQDFLSPGQYIKDAQVKDGSKERVDARVRSRRSGSVLHAHSDPSGRRRSPRLPFSSTA